MDLDRIARILQEKGLEVKSSTVRYVLRRYKLSIKYKRSRYRRRNRFYDFEALYPLQHFQVDLKEVYDSTTLSEQTLRWAREIKYPTLSVDSHRCKDQTEVYLLLL